MNHSHSQAHVVDQQTAYGVGGRGDRTPESANLPDGRRRDVRRFLVASRWLRLRAILKWSKFRTSSGLFARVAGLPGRAGHPPRRHLITPVRRG
jgi:hypothetical protein